MNRILFILVISMLLLSCYGNEVKSINKINIKKIKTRTQFYAPLTLKLKDVSLVSINETDISPANEEYVLEDAGFYEIVLDGKEKIQFVLLSADREGDKSFPEWGLKEWVPAKPNFTKTIPENVEILYPRSYINGISIPIVAKIKNWNSKNEAYTKCSFGGEQVAMKRGVASTSIPICANDITISVGGDSQTLSLQKNESSTIELSDSIKGDFTVSANSLFHITSDVTIGETASFTVEKGAIIIIDEGVNVFNFGPIRFLGTREDPILVTCSDATKFFGGFISVGPAAEINAINTFFTRFSHNSGEEFSYGHAYHQALFKLNDSKQTFSECYFLDSPGQVFYPVNSEMKLADCIIQRTKTSGQINGGIATITDCYFSDFPEYSDEFLDSDNDAIYLNGVDAQILGSVFMYAKDDGIDSGGSDGGTIEITSCVIEGCFHEGIAMSSKSPVAKSHIIRSSIFTNCQQGIELGYSSSNHIVHVEDCKISNNYIGVRYGDNYITSYVEGKMKVTTSLISNNTKPSWNFVRKSWSSKPDNLVIDRTNMIVEASSAE